MTYCGAPMYVKQYESECTNENLHQVHPALSLTIAGLRLEGRRLAGRAAEPRTPPLPRVSPRSASHPCPSGRRAPFQRARHVRAAPRRASLSRRQSRPSCAPLPPLQRTPRPRPESGSERPWAARPCGPAASRLRVPPQSASPRRRMKRASPIACLPGRSPFAASAPSHAETRPILLARLQNGQFRAPGALGTRHPRWLQ
mmetsp:Transcript_16784/g.50840  ORF Transcript_16784/g.50840 Transcript_16784/m.50840 type:complete len:200 (+) Transcript_16784:143-742(+)